MEDKILEWMAWGVGIVGASVAIVSGFVLIAMMISWAIKALS